MAEAANKTQRIVTVDVMQGLAMVIVIIGHHLLPFMPAEYGLCHRYIYTFHMPFFIFISSFLIAHAYKSANIGGYLYKRFRKFFIPYVIVGLLVTLLAALKTGWETAPRNLLALIISPKQSEATFLWYIYLLFIFYDLYPIIYRLRKKAKPLYSDALLLAIGLLLFIFPCKSGILCLDYLTQYFIFYVLGILAASRFQWIKGHMALANLSGYIALIAFAICSLLYLRGDYSIRYLLPFVSIPALYGLSILFKRLSTVRQGLVFISKNCFDIYLIHMFFIQGLAYLFSAVSHMEKISVPCSILYIGLSSAISIIGSVLIFKIIRKFKTKFA